MQLKHYSPRISGAIETLLSAAGVYSAPKVWGYTSEDGKVPGGTRGPKKKGPALTSSMGRECGTKVIRDMGFVCRE